MRGRVELLEVLDPVSGRTDRVAVARMRHSLRVARAIGFADGRAVPREAPATEIRSYAGVPFRVLHSLERELTTPLCDDRLMEEWERYAFPSPGGWFTLSLQAPVGCLPVIVPKPWGREIWYTGMEARGVCEVGAPDRSAPLSWIVAAGRDDILGAGLGEIILLKILDPAPVPVLGDLYTEIHAEKNEVYVCTKVDPAVAGPGGEGWLRYGIARRAFDDAGRDPASFKARYLEAVKAYEVVRRRIDERLDDRKRAEGLSPRDPVDAARLALWHADLPRHDREEEARLRAAMDAFTELHPMRPGSVARVPVGVPHALQAGVRVIEFQTATYERRIVSFAQRVLTQETWDTEVALSLLDVQEALRSPLVPVVEGAPTQLIVDFPAFRVFRCALDSLAGPDGAPLELPVGNEATYELLHVIEGEFLAGSVLLPEGAYLVPRGTHVPLTGAGVFLRAIPKELAPFVSPRGK